jgi:Carboxypeptidase regulatory-like domain
MTANNYNCSQEDLYNACRIAWDLCASKSSDFGAFKSKYTPAFIARNRADVEAAARLPDAAARRAIAQSARMDMFPLRDTVVKYSGWLKSYIDDGFELSKREIMYNAACQSYLAKAKGENWGNVTALGSSTIQFIEENLATLTANDNMPTDFLQRVKDVTAAFKAAYATWLLADTAASDQTDVKIMSNNTIYNNVIAMLTDGQRLFKEDAAIAKQFSFATILAQIQDTKNAGLAGKVTQVGGKIPIVGAKVSIDGTDQFVLTDSDGKYELSPLSMGTYSITITFDTFITQTFADLVIRTGTMSRLNVQLTRSIGNTLLPQSNQ